MYKDGKLFTLYAVTSVHPGSGSNLSYVDLPIQREKHTSFPVIPGSAMKGVIRNIAMRVWNDNSKVNTYFGSQDTGETASSVAFTDAKILFYPVRSIRGIFAYVTCPYVLQRFSNEMKSIVNNVNNEDIFVINSKINDAIAEDEIIVSHGSELVIDTDSNNKEAGLEEYIFKVKEQINDYLVLNNMKKHIVSEVSGIEKRIAVVSDTVFNDFVNYAIEIRTRIKIDQTKGTAETGALFVVELIPSESIFYSIALFKENENAAMQDEIKKLLHNTMIQIGSDETIGNGIMKINYS